ncbi:FAD-dependent oxidoreductase [Parapusillimonas granuli]|uniref:FAD-dependent oxidoreductase n=1 Tax=Parapusillimonas granuli TaxID=380911 RepID=A0A853FR70_9BURK|nr:FAD-dependent oxidoreductase [Parapusillimonas granuli]MBB5213495.1 fumarate reductase flavoprotein subunit [Parapusillimonas granuli]NYT48334.1 FAD-dependent oxidoreductase [Parapusillimonas granuli]
MPDLSVQAFQEAGPPARRADVVIAGAGACGLTAALAARDAGAGVLVVEQDAQARGTTAMTWGMLPGAGTRHQRALGIEDTPECFAADIVKKSGNRADPAVVQAVARGSGPAIEWLSDRHGLTFQLLDDVLYPGHSRHRYHVPLSRTGAELQQSLYDAARHAGADFLFRARITTLYRDADDAVRAVGCRLGDGREQVIGCGALVLATGGYGGNPQAVRTHIPAMADAAYCGHDGSRGDALAWGGLLGAALGDLGGYQGHCVVDESRLPLTWTLVIEGGIQVNRLGRRFSNEMSGYSEQAAALLRQPGGVAFTLYDQRSERLALRYADYRQVLESGAVRQADSLVALAQAISVPQEALAAVFADIEQSVREGRPDAYGRRFSAEQLLRPPYRAVRLRGALFHTQGGLCVDERAALLRAADGKAFPNIFAGGGAARGVSGPEASGYLGGNGLVTAVVLGRLAGGSAARAAGFEERTEFTGGSDA